MAKHPAIFLDRDGTIVEDRGYIKDPSDIIFYPESFSALNLLQEHFLLFIITNQSGISKGLTTESEVQQVNNHVIETLEKEGIAIYDIFSCPHKTEDNCTCKKPKPYFIIKAAEKYNLDLPHSYILGDHPSDVLCGLNAGVHPIYLLTGHGLKHRHELTEKVKICNNILEAAYYITGAGGSSGNHKPDSEP
jgi:D-glycero-D-manno-heptose 1,7-bisphosphate phosphatase